MIYAIRVPLASALAISLAMIMAGTAAAQFPLAGPPGPPANPPTVSPYLNLARPGSTAINYYGLVRPQFAFQSAIGGLQQQMANTQLGLNRSADTGTGLPVTGHAAVFMNTGGYFMSSGAGAGQAGFGASRGRSMAGAGQQAPAVSATSGAYGPRR